ncbi:hypothetical protein VTG60DRAFT_751 [Thermothelomyces hinnuleus]
MLGSEGLLLKTPFSEATQSRQHPFPPSVKFYAVTASGTAIRPLMRLERRPWAYPWPELCCQHNRSRLYVRTMCIQYGTIPRQHSPSVRYGGVERLVSRFLPLPPSALFGYIVTSVPIWWAGNAGRGSPPCVLLTSEWAKHKSGRLPMSCALFFSVFFFPSERKKALSRAPGPSVRLWETPKEAKGFDPYTLRTAGPGWNPLCLRAVVCGSSFTRDRLGPSGYSCH